MYENQRTTYLRGLLQSYGTLSLPLGSGLSFSLLQIFQPLRLRQSVVDKKPQQNDANKDTQRDPREDARENSNAKEHEESPDVLAENGIEALHKSPRGRMVILGGPGTGKTTVLKYLIYHYAQQALKKSIAPLPIFLSLPDLARVEQDLDAYLAHIARAMGLEADYGQTLSHAIQHGHAFVCLDSLDEVLPRLRTVIIRQINELAQASGNTWVVGSRFTDYKGGQFQRGQFQEWELQPLDPERRLGLARQLLPELQRQLATSAQSMKTPHSPAYVQALSEHRQAATWGTNPLLFSLGAVVYLRRGNLSGSRAMLYREVIDALLETRGGDTQLRHILAHAALELYQIKGRTFTLDDLHVVLANLNTTQRATWNVTEMRYRVLNSGLLDVVAAETYSFRHQTFQEYLAASALAWRFMSTDEQIRETAHLLAWSKHTYSRWNEVERLLIGILVQEYGEAGTLQARAWLARFLQQRHGVAGDPGNLSLELAIKALGEVAQLEEWQRAETLELEEMAATVWSEEVKNFIERTSRRRGDRQYDRYWVMAAEIGQLRPVAQQKAIELLLKVLVEGGHDQLSEILGAIRSNYITQYLLEALERYPDPNSQRSIKSIFEHLGGFAPIDFLLDELSSQEYGNSSNAEQALRLLASYVPAEKLVPILRLRGFGRPAAAEGILQVIAKGKELPVQDLLHVLYEGENEASFHAACVLASVQHPAAIDPLLDHLNDAQPGKRERALLALGQYKTLAPLGRIIAMLGDKDANIRRETVEVLAGFGSVVSLETFVQVAIDSDPGVRQKAIEVLGRLGDQAPLEMLIQATSDPHSWVTSTAIFALGALGSCAPLELLLDFLQKQNLIYPTLKALSEKELAGRVPAQPLLDLYEQNWEVRGEILNALSNTGYPVANTLLMNEICNEYREYSVATELLGQKEASLLIAERIDVVGERCYPPYIRAVAILGCWQERHAIDGLLKALADERWHVSDAAASELCKRADEPAQADLLALLNHRHAWVRKNALRVLAECINLPPLELLVVALHDSNDQVREVAAKALRKHREDAPLDELLAATLDDSVAVRREAVVTLSKLGRRDPALAVTGVMNLLRSEATTGEYSECEGDGYEAAWEAFVELASFAPAEILLQAMYDLGKVNSRCAANALGQMGERTPIEQLAHALQDQHPHIQEAAAYALSMTGKRAPVVALIKALNTKNPSVKSAVIAALTKVSEYGNVPDEIFCKKILKKRNYSTYVPLFQAFNAQRKRIPEEIVVDALAHFPHKDTLVILQYLSQFAELLPAFPERMVAEALSLSLHNVGQRYVTDADREGIIKRLLPMLSVNSLLETLTHRKSKVRIGVWELLAKYPGAIPLEPILSALHDPDDTVRCEAIECLQKRPENLPVQAIIACLQDTNTWVCKAAINALASLGSLAPLPDLMAMLDEPAQEVRSAAIQALAQPGLFEHVPVEMFINALGEYHYGYGEERQIALEVLCKKDPRIAIEHCIAALGDSNDEYALAAFKLLQQIHPAIIPDIVQEAAALFEGGKPGRFFRTLSASFLADVIGDINLAAPGLIARLSELLDWPYWEVRMKVVRALGKQRRNIPDTTIRRLLDLRHDPHSRAVCEAADEALAEILSLETGIEDD